MPTTVNGIGTHYYGKKNHSTRTAACGSCGRVGLLNSYDTRLWFVIVFIPVIPLGRKRIIDACPSCSRHMVANADTYEQARQLQTSASLEHYRREPSPETALAAHAQLLSFREYDQASEFRRAVLERFPDDAALYATMASHLDQVSAYQDAAPLYQEAFEIQPDLPEARVGVARRMMGQGELDEARQLLDFLETPKAGQHHSLGPIDQLSTYYQNAGRHEEALEIAEHLLREIPDAGRQHAFRTFVRKSEKALRRPGSILPAQGHSVRGLFKAEGSPYSSRQRKLVFWVIGLALLTGGLLINNEYIRTHRKIHVVNASGKPVTASVDDGPPRAVAGRDQLVVSEGPHRIRLMGAVDETIDVDLRASFLERWTHKPLWVLNPGGEAVLEELTVYYAKQPPPPSRRLIVGEPFVTLPHVDYAFESPPDSISVKGSNDQYAKTVFQVIQGPDRDTFFEILGTNRDGALKFAERRLRRDPSRADLLESYMTQAKPDEAPRFEAFLKAGIDHRPVSVPWHRAYQTFAELDRHDAELVATYERMLAADPKNGALLYLRGRVDPDFDRQADFYRRAADADHALSWPWMALGARAAYAGRWDEGLKLIRKAQELKIDEEQAADLIHVVRLATNDGPKLIEDYRARLKAEPMGIKTIVLLCDALAATGRDGEVAAEVDSWVNRLPMQVRSQVNGPMRAITAYQAGKLEECDKQCGELPSFLNGSLRVQALLAMGKVDQVAADPAFKDVWEDPWSTLSVSLAMAMKGKNDAATEWRDRSIRRLDALVPETRRAAKVLGATEPPSIEDLARVILPAEDKALILAVLAERFPAKKAEYRAEAARFNIRRQPPSQLVRRAIEGGPTAGP